MALLVVRGEVEHSAGDVLVEKGIWLDICVLHCFSGRLAICSYIERHIAMKIHRHSSLYLLSDVQSESKSRFCTLIITPLSVPLP